MPDHSLFRLRILPWCIALAMSGSYSSVWAEDDIQFDSRFLELKGDTKIDLKRFSSQGYVEPGKYNLQVQLNKQPLAEEYDIYWYAGEDDVSKSYACLTPELVAQFGLKEDVAKNLQWSHDGKCLKPGQLEGMEIKADLSQSALVISLPQAYLEYTWPDWDPPSRWDDGISGIIADYSITAQTRHEENGGDDSNEISGNGTVGVNLGPWRMRADWQTNYQHTRSNDDDDEFGGDDTQKKWEWSRYYAWRALPSLKAKLALGEDYLNSDIFDGFNYVGGSVSTDDQMLPPNLRGYAPDISGVAHTTAKVTVSQMGRVIYETQVPAGPFRIQDLGDSVSGTLHIRIEEQNGQVQEYDISTASMPYLTRPGQVRYKIMMGRPQEWGHHVEGGFFSGAEASWGIANGWSLYGGALGDENYQSAALGVGRDLSTFGAVAFDVTHSHTKLDKDTAYGKGSLDGNSFRVSYSKDFDQLNSRVTFAGYRFSEENFMTMSEYLDASDSEMVRTGNDKEMYTATYNQNFRDAGVSVYLNYTRHTYWDREEQTNYNIMLSHYFNMGSIRNMSVSLTGYRYEYDNRADKGMYISLSMPWGDNSTVSYNGNYGSGTDSSLTTILNPEAVIFANPIAQGACAADAIASAFNMPLDVLFWCAGSQGSMYPFNGWVSNESSPLQSSLLVSERMAFKLHRQGMIMETIGKNNAVCNEYPSPILPKERWRYQMVNMYPDSGQCHPFGRSVMRWETGKNPPNTKKNFGYLMWRKRNCVFL